MPSVRKDEVQTSSETPVETVVLPSKPAAQPERSNRQLDSDQESEEPLQAIISELRRIAADSSYSAVKLRTVIESVYPRGTKEDSMVFLAKLTRLARAAEVAFQAGNEIHARVLNTW